MRREKLRLRNYNRKCLQSTLGFYEIASVSGYTLKVHSVF
jgi:hypothetical protein